MINGFIKVLKENKFFQSSKRDNEYISEYNSSIRVMLGKYSAIMCIYDVRAKTKKYKGRTTYHLPYELNKKLKEVFKNFK